jgi:hypothetical protein
MEVTEQPIALLANKPQREIALLAPGLRIIMTGVEALALWTELGEMLKDVYGLRPAAPAAVPGAPLRERSSSPSAPTWSKEVAVDQLLKGIIAHAQASSAEPKRRSESDPVSKPNDEPARSLGVVGRAFGKLTGR